MPHRSAASADVCGVAALADDLRRELYDVVVEATEPIGREQAAQLAGVPLHAAKFHLDKLVEAGLLDVEYRRLSGRSGPGAGRPAKLYRRVDREIAVALPARHYDLLSRILANAVAVASTSGEPVRQVAARVARAEGEMYGAGRPAAERDLAALADALADNGYEPHLETSRDARDQEQRLTLRNCPFHRAAQEQTELVCSLNLDYVEGICAGLGCRHVRAILDPEPGRCCVTAAASSTGPRSGSGGGSIATGSTSD